jgi:AcrR family transcriptional regulator
MTARRTAPRRKRLNRAAREASLLDAAAEIVCDEGVEALTMEGVADRAGVNKALVYRFFQNRDAVLLALWDRETSIFDGLIEQAVGPKETLEEKLYAIVEVWLDEMEAGGGALGRLYPEGVGPPVLDERRWRRTAGIVDFFAGLFAADYRISRQDAIIVASVLVAGSVGLNALWAGGRFSRRKLSDTFVRACIGAVEAAAR